MKLPNCVRVQPNRTSADIAMAEPNPTPTITPENEVLIRDFQNGPATTVRQACKEETSAPPAVQKAVLCEEERPTDQPEAQSSLLE